MFNSKKQLASALHREAQDLSEAGQEELAIAKYQEAIACDPGKSASHYNLGLIYKYRGDWAKALAYSRRASQLDPEDEAARWNLAIAATALRDWDSARQAWAECGIELDGTSGPIEMNFGITPVRLDPDGQAEVVWARRIDPVRARIESIPYAESG